MSAWPSTIRIENSGMVTIYGGKWTTYRHMAEDCVNQAATIARLPEKPCVTKHLNIHGFHPSAEKFGSIEAALAAPHDRPPFRFIFRLTNSIERCTLRKRYRRMIGWIIRT